MIKKQTKGTIMPRVQHFAFDADDPASNLNPPGVQGVTVHIVSDEQCPHCGALWGHDDKALDFPNRPKVYDEYGEWWRCYNPNCDIGYYNPQTGGIELRLTPEQEEAQRARIREQFSNITFEQVDDNTWKTKQN